MSPSTDRISVRCASHLTLGLAALLWCSGLNVSGGASVPEPDIAQVKMINAAFQQQWKDYALTPAPVEDDSKWCRRVFLDLIGRIPNYDELTRLQSRSRSSASAKNWSRRLLNDDRYTEEFANHWGTIWSNILIGRSGGNDRNSFISRDGMGKYLRDCFASNKPYNQMVYELVTAAGTTKARYRGFNGATNFLIDKVNEEGGTLATSSTSRIFLGLQVQCTQCHNHPFNQWKQQKFWEFNAFFRQSRALRRFVPGTRDIDFAELVDQDFAGREWASLGGRDLLRRAKWIFQGCLSRVC